MNKICRKRFSALTCTFCVAIIAAGNAFKIPLRAQIFTDFCVLWRIASVLTNDGQPCKTKKYDHFFIKKKLFFTKIGVEYRLMWAESQWKFPYVVQTWPTSMLWRNFCKKLFLVTNILFTKYLFLHWSPIFRIDQLHVSLKLRNRLKTGMLSNL